MAAYLDFLVDEIVTHVDKLPSPLCNTRRKESRVTQAHRTMRWPSKPEAANFRFGEQWLRGLLSAGIKQWNE